jgi:DNA helicase-2/ATP-dependent DNA helicase PcrA
MALADSLVGDESSPGRPGPKPRFTRVTDEAALADVVAERVEQALDEGPNRHVCVVLRHRKDSGELADELRTRLRTDRQALVRVGHNKDFRFEPGVTVTNMRQIKGLEFDAVIAIEPSAEAYPDDDQGRRWLYTVLTRAKQRLELVGIEDASPLLGPALEEGLLAQENQAAVPEVEFDDADDDPF